jgi:hypothetical protein
MEDSGNPEKVPNLLPEGFLEEVTGAGPEHKD